jgi:hypothetical protein
VWLQLALAASIMGVTAGALPLYQGGAFPLLLFGASAAGLAVVGGLQSGSVYCRLLTLFLCLGFWAKLVAHLLGATLIEPIGLFDGSATEWDRALIVAAIALGATALAIACCNWLDRHRSFAVSADTPRFAYVLIPVFLLSASVAVALFALNARYGILAMGVVPRLKLHPYLYVAVAFIVSWGAMLWLGALTYWMVVHGRIPVHTLFYLAAVEGALAATTMDSRAQMILHVLAVVVVYALGRHRLQWHIATRQWIGIGLVTGALFVASIAAVSIDRTSRVAAVGNPAELAVASVMPFAATPCSASTAIPVSNASLPLSTPSADARLRIMEIELPRLVIMRWIGLEGVMTMTAARGEGLSLFSDIIKERPEAGNDAIYQRLSNSRYRRMQHFVFLTLPGPVAVLMSSGSMAITVLGMMTLIFAGYAIETFAILWTKNPVASGVSGCALAYLVANMNFPRTLLFFSLMLVCALGMIGVFRMLALRPAPLARPDA